MMSRKAWTAAATCLWVMVGCGDAELDGPGLVAVATERVGGSPGAVIVHAGGTLNQAAELQGSRPGALDEASLDETLAMTADGRIAHEMELDRIDGTRDWVREVYEADSKTIHLMSDSFSVRLEEHPEVSGQRRLRRRLPGHLLREAGEASSITRLPDSADTAVVRVTLAEDGPLDLHIGPDSLVHRVSYEAEFPGLGETRVTWAFSDYRDTPAGLIPHRYVITVGDLTFADMSVEWVRADEAEAESLLAPPEGFAGPRIVNQANGPDGDAVVEELGDGLFRVRSLRGGFHPSFVEFDEFVAVIDAPAGYPLMLELPAGDVAPGPVDWLGERFVELIREALPDKPVRHVVLTHFHNDHAGGVRPFLGPDVTIHAPPGDTSALRRFIGPGNSARISGVATNARITDGRRSLDLIQVGPNPHTHEMLFAYLHEPATLFVHDLVPGVSAEALRSGDGLTPAGAFLRRWLARVDVLPAHLVTIHSTEVVELTSVP